jgi:hypothetical protein
MRLDVSCWTRGRGAVTPPRFNARKYIDVLEDILVPPLNILYAKKKRHGPFVFVQDNCSIYTVHCVDESFEDNNGLKQRSRWPVKSPNLNHIENVCGHMVNRWNDISMGFASGRWEP